VTVAMIVEVAVTVITIVPVKFEKIMVVTIVLHSYFKERGRGKDNWL
jgi:hypothetical protein